MLSDDLTILLGSLSVNYTSPNQAAMMEQAFAADPKGLERTVVWAKAHTENPAAVIYNKAKEICAVTQRADDLRTTASAEQAEKKVRAMRNYSATALGVIPAAEHDAILREEFPWADAALLAECLELGASAAQKQAADEALILEESEGNKRYRAAMEEKRKARVSAETTRSSTVGATAGNDEGEG